MPLGLFFVFFSFPKYDVISSAECAVEGQRWRRSTHSEFGKNQYIYTNPSAYSHLTLTQTHFYQGE